MYFVKIKVPEEQAEAERFLVHMDFLKERKNITISKNYAVYREIVMSDVINFAIRNFYVTLAIESPKEAAIIKNSYQGTITNG